jgi:hypothetical protein
MADYVIDTSIFGNVPVMANFAMDEKNKSTTRMIYKILSGTIILYTKRRLSVGLEYSYGYRKCVRFWGRLFVQK